MCEVLDRITEILSAVREFGLFPGRHEEPWDEAEAWSDQVHCTKLTLMNPYAKFQARGRRLGDSLRVWQWSKGETLGLGQRQSQQEGGEGRGGQIEETLGETATENQ